MSLLDPNSSLRVPGRLVADPTNVATAFPHGGTSLGLVRAISFRPGYLTEGLPFEEYGGKIGELIDGGESTRLGVVLVGFDDDMTSRIFPETSVGGGAGKRGLKSSDATRAGRLGSASGFKLLFSPRDTANHPALILYNAVANFEEAGEIALGTEENVGIALVFEALRDTSKRDWQLQRLQDIDL